METVKDKPYGIVTTFTEEHLNYTVIPRISIYLSKSMNFHLSLYIYQLSSTFLYLCL